MIELITTLKKDYPLRALCRIFQINKSTIYDRKHRHKESFNEEGDLEKALRKVCLEWKAYGYRRIAVEVRKMGFHVGKKKVYRIMKKLGLLCKKKKKWISTTDSDHTNPVFPNLAPNLIVTGVNQLWVGDISYVPIGSKKFAYVATLMDVYSRKVIGWDVSMNIDTQLCLSAFKMALNTRKGESLDGLVHHTDRGVQYTSKEYKQALDEHKILGSMSRKGNPYDNAYAESLFKTLKSEWLDRHDPESYAEVWNLVNVFFKKYNSDRLHSSIGYQAPNEFERQCLVREEIHYLPKGEKSIDTRIQN